MSNSEIVIKMDREHLDDLYMILNSDLSRLLLCGELLKEIYETLKTITSEIGYKFVNTLFDKDCKDMGKCYRYYTSNENKIFSLVLYNDNHEKMIIKFDTTCGKIYNNDNSAYTNIRCIDCLENIADIYCYDVNYIINRDIVIKRLESIVGGAWSKIQRLNEIQEVVRKHLETIDTIERMMKGNNNVQS